MASTMELDPESAQVREVYAYYGLAMYWAQCLEQSIFQHLLFFEHFPKAVEAYTTPEKWAQEFDQYEERELGQTMGKLIRRLQEAGQPTDEIRELLGKSLKNRNWLAHEYFSDRAIAFTQFEGRTCMIDELEALKDGFQHCAALLDAITLPVARKFGLTDERLAEIEAEMFVEYARAVGPISEAG